MKQTAVEWLVSNMPNIGEYIPLGVTLEFQAKIEQAKAMEKEQIIKARINGDVNGACIFKISREKAEQYYNETYESNI